MTAWVRSGVLVGAPELIAELGHDAARLAREAGIDRAALIDPDFPVPVTAVVTLLQSAAEVCGCDTFGLRLSRRQALSLFGPLWPLFETAPSVGALLRALVDYFPMHTQGALVSIEPDDGGVTVVYAVAAGVGSRQRQVVELGLGILVAELQRWAPDWRPSLAMFRHSAPQSLALHRQIFGAAIDFNADRNGLFIEAELLKRPNRAGDARRHSSLAQDLAERRMALPGAVRVRAEIAVRGLLPFADCDLPVTARVLGLTPRTLQRRLAEDGTSFDRIVDQVRADLALSYLRDSDLTATAVSEILQFSQTSALSRAFRRWFGVSPRAMRRSVTAAGVPTGSV